VPPTVCAPAPLFACGLGAPEAMFSVTVPAKRKPSCGTMRAGWRSDACVTSRRSWPSIVMRPARVVEPARATWRSWTCPAPVCPERVRRSFRQERPDRARANTSGPLAVAEANPVEGTRPSTWGRASAPGGREPPVLFHDVHDLVVCRARRARTSWTESRNAGLRTAATASQLSPVCLHNTFPSCPGDGGAPRQDHGRHGRGTGGLDRRARRPCPTSRAAFPSTGFARLRQGAGCVARARSGRSCRNDRSHSSGIRRGKSTIAKLLARSTTRATAASRSTATTYAT